MRIGGKRIGFGKNLIHRHTSMYTHVECIAFQTNAIVTANNLRSTFL